MEDTPLCCIRLKSLYYLKFIFYTTELCNLVLSVITSSDTSELFVVTSSDTSELFVVTSSDTSGLFVVTSSDTSGLLKFCELNTY